MYRYLFTLLISALLYAQPIHFKEIKLIEALELETFREGSINYDEEKIIIRYKKGKIITKIDNILTVHSQTNELLDTIDLNKHANIAIYFRLIKSLFFKDFKTLEKDFKITKVDKRNSIFIPHTDTKNIVDKIELSLNDDGRIKLFSIYFKNKDTIRIETK